MRSGGRPVSLQAARGCVYAAKGQNARRKDTQRYAVEGVAMIYLVTTLNLDRWENYRSRAVGYLETLEEAMQAVITNEFDIYENGHYPYAVIEEVPSGIYPHGKEYWYEWVGDVEAGGYKAIVKPRDEKNICNYGIG